MFRSISLGIAISLFPSLPFLAGSQDLYSFPSGFFLRRELLFWKPNPWVENTNASRGGQEFQ